MKMRFRAEWRALVLAVPLAALAHADLLITREGNRYYGQFVSANRRTVRFTVDNGGRRNFNVNDIESIRFGSDYNGSADRSRPNNSGVFQDYGSANRQADRDNRRYNDNDAIERKYYDLGGPNGFAGGSVSDERVTANGRGRYREYENATIFWSSQTGAHELHGAIRDEYMRLGGPDSRLGFPTSDEQAANNGRVAYFENGTIHWNANRGATVTYNNR